MKINTRVVKEIQNIDKAFYHSADLDGHASGAVIKHKYPDCELIGINYGDEFPWDSISENDTIIMSDFGLQPFSDMVKLKNKCKELIWCDHHITAMDEYDKSNIELDGIRDVTKAGCELTWEYLFPNEPIPTIIHHLGRYDVWDHSDTNSVLIKYGMEQYEDTFPTADLWKNLLEDDSKVNKLIEDGTVIKKYHDATSKILMDSLSFDAELDGYKCLVINSKGNSAMFDSKWDEALYDIMLRFTTKDGKWNLSFYTTKNDVHCGELDQKYGGGGNAQAAGCLCEDLPSKI